VSCLPKKKLNVATVESATAGRLAYEFSLLEQSGKILIGGIVCYDAGVKKDLLKLSSELVEKYTPESAEVTAMMSEALRRLLKADVYVATTGLTTPGGSENESKPVGTIFVHILYRDLSLPLRKEFKGDAVAIVDQTVDWIAEELIRICQ